MPDTKQKTYQAWLKKYGLQETSDYDTRAAFNAGLTPDSRRHLPDQFKRPNHITYSTDSIYADKGPSAGRWEGSDKKGWTFYASPTNIKNAGGSDKLQEYFKTQEPEATLVMPKPDIRDKGVLSNLLDFNKMRDDSANAGNAFFEKSTEHNGPSDAMRHVLFNAKLTTALGPQVPWLLDKVHEYGETVFTKQPKKEMDMDLANGELGREIGKLGLSDAEMVDLAQRAVQGGKAVTLDQKSQQYKYAEGGDVRYDKKKVDDLVAEIKLPPVPTLSKKTKATTAKKETIGDTLENLSYGLGEGFANQLRGTAQLIEHPIESGKTMIKGVQAVIKDPSIIKDVAQDIAERATGSTQGLGEVIGENINPVGVAKRLAGVGNPALKIIKEKGGNWLKGNTIQTVSPENYAGHLTSAGQSDELNNWINTKLVKYMKNDMGTAEDPVRKLFEQGVRHAEVRNQYLPQTTMRTRMDAGMPPKGMAENPMGEAWEGAVDMTILPRPSFRYMPSTIGSSKQTLLENNPWLAKVPPETPVHGLSDQLYANDDRLGFQHLVDELHNATHPAGDLPEHLRLDPKKLEKVTVPQAVQLVDKINKWRAENMVEANALVANNPATILHKDYPEAGFKWVQLTTPLDPKVRLENPTALRDALKYEGDVMGHCVGGYCPAVEKGESQIFSLRDKKGEPHVTIEVAPQDITPHDYYQSGEMSDDLMNRLNEEYRYGGRGGPTWNDKIEESQEYQDYIQSLPPTIVQIKGKSNAAPVDKYLPYVQDFVKSRDWHSVGDLENASLYTLDRDPYDELGMGLMQLRSRMDEAGHRPAQKYYTEDELNDLFSKYKINTEGYAEGGLVAPTASMEYDPERVQSIADQLRKEMHLE